MIKKGYEILKAREDEIDLNKIEVPFPELYKLFSKLYELGEDGFRFDKFYRESKDKYYHTQVFYYEPRGKEETNITFTNFDKLEVISTNWKQKLGYTEEEINLGLIRIGGIALGGGLFVGTGKNADNIYLNIWDSEEGLVKLEDDIFSFAKNLVLEPDEVLPGNVKHEQLYKNWNENFWRVKDDVV